MHVPLSIWLITSAVILGFFIFDFVSHVRTPHEPTMKESGGWALFYMTMACIFGGIVWWLWDGEHGMQFFTGYITELSLSVDNLFVFALIMGAFKIPRAYQQKVLLIGIVIALICRLVFILLGAVIIEAWSDVFYIFAAFLIYTAIKMVYDEVTDQEDPDPNDMMVVKTLRKVIPVTKSYHSDRLVSRTQAGKKAVTPLFVALLSIGFIDVMFAFDSIQAGQGVGNEFLYIIAAVIGGCAMTGGRGTAVGTAIGALIFGLTNQGIVYAGWNPDWFKFFLGATLLFAVFTNTSFAKYTKGR